MPASGIQITEREMICEQPGGVPTVLREAAESDSVTISVDGAVTYSLAPFLEEELLMAVTVFQTVNLDLEKTTSLCSPCYEGFLNVQRWADARNSTVFCLRKVPRPILEEIARIGYSYILDIRDE